MDREDLISGISVLLQLCRKNMFIESKVENWNIIIDYKNTKIYNLPYKVNFYYKKKYKKNK